MNHASAFTTSKRDVDFIGRGCRSLNIFAVGMVALDAVAADYPTTRMLNNQHPLKESIHGLSDLIYIDRT